MARQGVLGDRYGIKAEIERRGVSLAQLSRDLGFADHAVRASLTKPMPQVDRALAAWLGLSPHALWPDRYDRDGNRTPLRSRRARASTLSGHGRNRKGARAEPQPARRRSGATT